MHFSVDSILELCLLGFGMMGNFEVYEKGLDQLTEHKGMFLAVMMNLVLSYFIMIKDLFVFIGILIFLCTYEDKKTPKVTPN